MRETPSTRRTATAPLIALVLVGALCHPRAARAAGFAIGEQGTAATGMVGAFVAKADDPSAIFFNPAGIASQRRLHVYVGGLLVLGQASVEGTASFPLQNRTKSDFLAQPLATIYLSYGLPHDFAVGIGVFTNFGLKVGWPGDWPGRYLGTYVNLQTVTINPTIAWRPIRWFSIGVGLDLTPASVDLQRSLNLGAADALLRFRGNDLGIGGNVGVLFQGPILRNRHEPLLSFGVTYRSAFDLNFDDGALTPTVPLEFSRSLPNAAAAARLKLPDQVSVGLGVRPVDHLFLQLQYDWVRWSRIQAIELVVRDNPAANLTLEENWRSGHIIRFGGELEIGRWKPRLGVGYDWSPVPRSTLNPLIPDSNRIFVSAGLGVDLPARLTAELSAMGVIFDTRTSEVAEFPARYSNWALIISGAVSYRGDRGPRRHEREEEYVPAPTARPLVPPPPQPGPVVPPAAPPEPPPGA